MYGANTLAGQSAQAIRLVESHDAMMIKMENDFRIKPSQKIIHRKVVALADVGNHSFLPDDNLIAARWGEHPREPRFIFNTGLPAASPHRCSNPIINTGAI
jgi:hypothetical protein